MTLYFDGICQMGIYRGGREELLECVQALESSPGTALLVLSVAKNDGRAGRVWKTNEHFQKGFRNMNALKL